MNLTSLLAEVPPKTIWNAPSGSTELIIKVLLTMLVGGIAFFLVRNAGPRWRRVVVGGFTFAAGAFYVLLYVWPQPIARHPDQMPSGFVEHVSFYIDDATPIMGGVADIVGGFLLGLGVYSILRVHIARVMKQQRDWGFSVVLLVCIVLMATFGYWDWYLQKINPDDIRPDRALVHSTYGFLFDGVYQEMTATMFSIIAFFILSAAFRAFRVRSIGKQPSCFTTALIVILSLMAVFEFWWTGAVGHLGPVGSMFTLTEIYKWIQNSLQSPALRAIDFGMGIGALAMGLRLWLSLEKQGAN